MSPILWSALYCCLMHIVHIESASLANQELFEIPHPKFRLLKPRGFQLSIPDSHGIQLVAFHGNLNEKMRKMDDGQFSEDIVNKTNANWIYQNRKLKLAAGDVIYFWMFVIKNGKGYTFDDGIYQISDAELYRNTKKINKRYKRYMAFHHAPFPSDHIFGDSDDSRKPFGHGHWHGSPHHGHTHHHTDSFHFHHGHMSYRPHDWSESFDSNEHDSHHHNCGHKHFGHSHGRGGHKHGFNGHRGYHWSDEEPESTEASFEQTTNKYEDEDKPIQPEPKRVTKNGPHSEEVTTIVNRRPLPVSIPVYEEPMEDIPASSSPRSFISTTTTDSPPIDIRFGQR